MKYSKVSVKCSHELILEIDKFMDLTDICTEVLADFLQEVKEGVSEQLLKAEKRNDELVNAVYAEFSMTLPKSVYESAKSHIQNKYSEYSELYLLFENIARVKEYLFKR